MDHLVEIFQYRFFLNALLASLLTSISCGIVGTYIVSRRMVFMSGGITHASFGGIGIGYYFGINPILGAAVFAVLSSVGIEYFSRRGNIRLDSAIGILWSLGMAIGIIFIFLTPGYAPNLMSFLFGSILTVSPSDLWMMLSLTAVILLIFGLMFKMILFVAFDEEFARTHDIPVVFINYLMICLVGLTIVFGIRVVGIILVISLLTIPQTIASLMATKFKSIALLSIVMGFTGSVAGLILSFLLNIPSGASIIFSLVVLYLLVKGATMFGRVTR